MDLELIKKLCAEEKLRWTNHIFLRLIQRSISIDDVQKAILSGEIIENYPEDYPFPSCLIFGYRAEGDVIHVVCAPNDEGTELWLITAYIPKEEKWMPDLKTRRTDHE